jgi:hypothetical protein
MLLSQYLGLDDELENLGVLDIDISSDIPFFINIQSLRTTTVPEFRESYESLNRKFSETIFHLSNSTDPFDEDYMLAYNVFSSSELREICLGYSKGKIGHGFGPHFVNKTLQNIKEIIVSSQTSPELFHLVSLFIEGIGCDLLSDMIGTFIEDEIRDFTIRINKELNILSSNPRLGELGVTFNGDFVRNIKKDNISVYYVPKEIVSYLPIEKEYLYPNDFITNQDYREEVSRVFGGSFREMSSVEKKERIKNLLLMLDLSQSLINEYRDRVTEKYDFGSDLHGPDHARYVAKRIHNDLPDTNDWKSTSIYTLPMVFHLYLETVFGIETTKELLKVNGKYRKKLFFATLVKNLISLKSLDDINVDINSSLGIIELSKDNSLVRLKVLLSRADTSDQIIRMYNNENIAIETKIEYVLVFNTKRDRRWLDKTRNELSNYVGVDRFPKVMFINLV